MKRHTQTTGVRYWFGGDLLDLQAEPLKVLDGFFSQYGNFVISGCEVTPTSDGKYNISEGLVALQGNDPDGEPVKIVVPFAGLSETVLPVYLTLSCEVLRKTYADGSLKPVAYDYMAVASNIQPETDHLEIASTSAIRFVDVIQDSSHETLNASKSYTDTAIAGLAGTAPETLDTLQELAAALGNDPNFATTVLNQIGQKVDKVTGKGLSTNDYTTEEKNQLAALLKKVEVPVGSVEAFAGVKAKIPEGWMLCDGRTLLRADYPELFDAISTTFGYTTSANFKIPDLRGEFIRGFSDGKSGIDTGRSFGSAQADAFQGHWHKIGYDSDDDWFAGYTSGGNGHGWGAGYGQQYLSARDAKADASNHGTPRTASETRPRNIALNYIIKVKSSL